MEKQARTPPAAETRNANDLEMVCHLYVLCSYMERSKPLQCDVKLAFCLISMRLELSLCGFCGSIFCFVFVLKSTINILHKSMEV